MVHACFQLIDVSGGLLNKMPFLRFIAPSLSGYNMITTIVNEMMNFFQVSMFKAPMFSKWEKKYAIHNNMNLYVIESYYSM